MSPSRYIAVALWLAGSLAGPAPVRAQTSPGPRIYLKSRTFSPAPGIEPSLLQRLDESTTGARIHVIAQFETPPTPTERGILESVHRIRLLDAFHRVAYFVSLPADDNLALGALGDTRFQLRWLGEILVADKVAQDLWANAIPAHAHRADGLVELVVHFFDDVPEPDQEVVLEAAVHEIVERLQPIHAWHVVLDPAEIRDLAAEEPVKWIEAAPAPPVDDNDSVRGLRGVNSDAVGAGSPFELTGSGVTVAQWESTHPSPHMDYAGRLTLGDFINVAERNFMHDESVNANGAFDNGEQIYVDLDDSGSVTAGDVRIATTTLVSGGDADVGNALVFFRETNPATTPHELYHDANGNGVYTVGEAIVDDRNFNDVVDVGDTSLNGTLVAAGEPLKHFAVDPHWHSTMVAGTMLGDGGASDQPPNVGAAGQWAGVAPSASLRSYTVTNRVVSATEYIDAASAGVAVANNSWGTGHCMRGTLVPESCYDSGATIYDAVTSGRNSAGQPSGLSRRISVVGSAGNLGAPERHTENVSVNGAFDPGEHIYRDVDRDGLVSSGDAELLTGTGTATGALVDFTATEVHSERNTLDGIFASGEDVYLDLAGPGVVSVGDRRLAVAGFAAGSAVVAGDADIGRAVSAFHLWGGLRVPNAAKNTIQAGGVATDAPELEPWSSLGPPDDGRIKPDVVAAAGEKGGDAGVTSTFPGNAYAVTAGTSMASAAVSGSLALLVQRYRAACQGSDPDPSVLRALIVHGAEDIRNVPTLGDFPGPDYATGFGRVRVDESVRLIPHHATGSSASLPVEYKLTIGEMQTLRATLAWDDPAWTPNAAPDPIAGRLLNDLDLVLIAPDGTTYLPWLLNPLAPGSAATASVVAPSLPVLSTMRDHRNNIEQVSVPNAAPGEWTIRVSAASLALPPQGFALVSEMLPPQLGACRSTPPVDVWMRDNPADSGAEPSSGSMWLGPDLWNRLAADGLTSHENPEYGQENYLYATLRNASNDPVASTHIDIWVASATLGLDWPDSFKFVGRFAVPNMGPLETRQVGPLPWQPPAPGASGHFCLYMRVSSPQDPITFVETSSVWANASASNNLAYRNMIIVDLASSRSVTVEVRNPDEGEVIVDLEFRVPLAYLSVGRLEVRLSPELAAMGGATSPTTTFGIAPPTNRPEVRSPVGFLGFSPRGTLTVSSPRALLAGFRLRRGASAPITLTFSGELPAGQTFPIDVVQRRDGVPLDGITFIVRAQGTP